MLLAVDQLSMLLSFESESAFVLYCFVLVSFSLYQYLCIMRRSTNYFYHKHLPAQLFVNYSMEIRTRTMFLVGF